MSEQTCRETMTLSEVCKTLRISRGTAYNRISAGVLSPIPRTKAQGKTGRLYFCKQDIEKLAEPIDEDR
jgi:predicted site-specific integrase-resolvase